MRRFSTIPFLWVVLVLSPPLAAGQGSFNPDISVVPRFLLWTDDGEGLEQGIREFARPDFALQELELGVQSNLNPFSRADVFLSFAGPDITTMTLGIEEVYVTVFKGLPLDINLRVGKYRAEYGKFNTLHPHAWSFVTQPIVEERFLGEDGLNDLGISASILLPTGDLYTRLTVDLLRGTSIEEGAGLRDTTGAPPFYANSARLMGFFPLTDDSDLEAGLSTYTGIHDPYYRDRFWYVTLDAKYKYRPSLYTSLTLQGEFLFNTRTAHQNPLFEPLSGPPGSPHAVTVTSGGFFVLADFQFEKIYSAGIRLDWAESPYSASDWERGYSLFAGFYPFEETLALRLEYRNRRSAESRTLNFIGLQLMFSMGPHRAHQF